MSIRLPPGDAGRDDDEFLDRLGRGEPVDGDEVERMLSTWRASMPTAGPTDERLLDAVTTAIARPARGRGRMRKATVTVAAAALLTGGGLTAVATQAGPGSPLWPVTELVFGGLAESRAAVDRADGVLRDARTAVDQGRLPEAARLLAHADKLADEVAEPSAAERIRDDVAAIRERLTPHVADAPSRSDASRGTESSTPTTTRSTPPTTTAQPSSSQPSTTSDRPFTGPGTTSPDSETTRPTRPSGPGQRPDDRPGEDDGHDDGGDDGDGPDKWPKDR
ncbi:hypothetical protein [Actinophytocola sediminis]